MGAYCSLHGFHPVGINHDSMTCIYIKPEHKIKATWCNRLGVNMFWPTAMRIAVEQQDHPLWKGKVDHQLTLTGDCKHINRQHSTA